MRRTREKTFIVRARQTDLAHLDRANDMVGALDRILVHSKLHDVVNAVLVLMKL